MAAIDFPSAPTLDQEVTLAGITYVWNGQGWVVKPGGSTSAPVPAATPPGVIVDFAGDVAPSGWLLCQGQSVAVATYPDLHAAIGFKYGGSGANFNVPDLGGRVTAGKEPVAFRLTTAYSGIDGATVGAAGGNQVHIMTEPEMPWHIHPFTGQYLNLNAVGSVISNYTGGAFSIYNHTDTAGAGGNLPHQNTQPTIIMNKIIKT